MSETKLILFEGVPGSGKSTAGAHLQTFLEQSGIPVKFWREGDFDHPADFEGVACLTESQYRHLLSRFPELGVRLEEQLTMRGADYLLKYRKLQHLHPHVVPQRLGDELSHYDVYDGLPMEDYCRLALQRWQDFTKSAEASQGVTILECCFLQNPLTVMLARHNADPLAARQQVMETARLLQPLSPRVIYLQPLDVRAALLHVRAERTQEWADFVTFYLTEQAYGKAHSIGGYEGVIQFYEMRQALELDLLKDLPLRSLVVEHNGTGWEHHYKEIIAFVRTNLPG